MAGALLSPTATGNGDRKPDPAREQLPLMQPSMFNLRVPLEARDEVFLMNTLTDAQLVVSSDVAALLDRAARGELRGAPRQDSEERDARALLAENGFLVESRAADRRALDGYLTGVKSNSEE